MYPLFVYNPCKNKLDNEKPQVYILIVDYNGCMKGVLR